MPLASCGGPDRRRGARGPQLKYGPPALLRRSGPPPGGTWRSKARSAEAREPSSLVLDERLAADEEAHPPGTRSRKRQGEHIGQPFS